MEDENGRKTSKGDALLCFNLRERGRKGGKARGGEGRGGEGRGGEGRRGEGRGREEEGRVS